MAGLGGSLGYAMGGINWDNTFIGIQIVSLLDVKWIHFSYGTGVMLGGHVRAVFTLVTFIFIACVIATLYSFSEIPLDVLADTTNLEEVTKVRNASHDCFCQSD